jgi:hypothetical protein
MAEAGNGITPASIDGQLVTAANPARTDLEGMDHARCAALHNYLVDYRMAAEGLAPVASSDTLISTLGEAAPAVLPKLHPSLAAFFAAACSAAAAVGRLHPAVGVRCRRQPAELVLESHT